MHYFIAETAGSGRATDACSGCWGEGDKESAFKYEENKV